MGHVFIAGSINMDVVAAADRHPKVGETVAGRSVHYFPGGKGANQAVAAAKLGASTALIGRLGTGAFGRQLRAFLAAQGVDLALVKDTTGADSGTAIITIADNCSGAFIKPITAVIAVPARPANSSAVTTGPSSLTSDKATSTPMASEEPYFCKVL